MVTPVAELLEELFGVRKEDVLDILHLTSPKDIAFFTGAPAAGLRHAHSDCDVFVITAGPISESRAYGTKFWYGSLKMDITYFEFGVFTRLLSHLDDLSYAAIRRIPERDLDNICRLVIGQPMVNEEGFEELKRKFELERVIPLISRWQEVRAKAALLEAFDALHRGYQSAAYACAQRAILSAAKCVAARCGDIHMNVKFVHEQCVRITPQAPRLLRTLWSLESTEVRSLREGSRYLSRCRRFFDTYQLTLSPEPSAETFLEVSIMPGNTLLVEPADGHYLVWNRAEVLKISPFVALIWTKISSRDFTIRSLSEAVAQEVGIEPPIALKACSDTIRTLEELGLVEFDWLGLVQPLDPVSEGF